MAFIQLIEAKSDKLDEIRALSGEYDDAPGGRGTLQRSIVTTDRNDPRRFVVVAFFESYESAMENSERPETQEFAGKLSSLVDGPVSFHDLDVVEDNDYA